MKLVLPVLACIVAFPAAQDSIDVHEWGVVLYAGDSIRSLCSAGAPWLAPVTVDAPVIYFHGTPFTGDVIVCSIGSIFSYYPEPDETGGPLWNGGGLGSVIRWSDISVGPRVQDVLPAGDRTAAVDQRIPGDITVPGFEWALDLWRIGGSSLITRQSDGFSDRFLYYEIDFTEVGFPVPLRGYAPAGTPREELAMEFLEFRRLESGAITCALKGVADGDASDESLTLPEVDRSCEAAFESMSGWAAGILTDEEIGAMWSTWEPWIYYGDWRGSRLIVFPIPQPVMEGISTIRVESDQGSPVEFDRFFLGMMPL